MFEKLSDEHSKEIEVDLIKTIGRRKLKTGSLTNLTDGGDGGQLKNILNNREVYMEMLKIYLAGLIEGSCIEKCYAWRKKIREHYENWKGTGKKYPLTFLDPLNGETFAEITPNGLKGSMPPHTIVHKDYVCVEKSDLIIANMETFGSKRGLCGTICELAWAWDKRKPIVMITTEDRYKIHPFLEYFSSWTVSSVDELLEKKVINGFFKAWHGAQY